MQTHQTHSESFEHGPGQTQKPAPAVSLAWTGLPHLRPIIYREAERVAQNLARKTSQHWNTKRVAAVVKFGYLLGLCNDNDLQQAIVESDSGMLALAQRLFERIVNDLNTEKYRHQCGFDPAPNFLYLDITEQDETPAIRLQIEDFLFGTCRSLKHCDQAIIDVVHQAFNLLKERCAHFFDIYDLHSYLPYYDGEVDEIRAIRDQHNITTFDEFMCHIERLEDKQGIQYEFLADCDREWLESLFEYENDLHEHQTTETHQHLSIKDIQRLLVRVRGLKKEFNHHPWLKYASHVLLSVLRFQRYTKGQFASALPFADEEIHINSYFHLVSNDDIHDQIVQIFHEQMMNTGEQAIEHYSINTLEVQPVLNTLFGIVQTVSLLWLAYQVDSHIKDE